MTGDVAARRPPPAVPVSILTGFLGAGKTTLLNRLLQAPDLADTLVLINEFGEIGLDHLLVERVEGDLILLQSGCLCCSIRGDLVATLEDILRRRDNGRMRDFSRVLIETTGLADPAPVVHTILSHPYLVLRFRLEAVVTVVDAVNGMATLDAHPEAVKQAAVADRLIISKTDLATEASVAALTLRLGRLNPTAAILEANSAEASSARLLETGAYDPSQKSADVRRWLNDEALAPVHAHHHHDVNRHDARIRAFCLRHPTPIAVAAFDLFLELLRTAHGPHLLRLKGIVALADDPDRPVLVHGVQHVFHPPVRLARWPDDDRTTRLVFILRDMEPHFVEGMWNALTGLPGPDAADVAARQANPLAPASGGLLA